MTKDSIDINVDCKSYYSYYYADFKCKDEYPFPKSYTEVAGQFKIDTVNKKITYSEMVQSSSYSDTKQETPEYVAWTDKQEVYVIELSADKFVLVERYNPQTESEGDFISYYTKVKK